MEGIIPKKSILPPKLCAEVIITVPIVVLCLCINTALATVAEPNLISWWKLDDGGGTTATDSAGSNNGSLQGDPQWTTGKIGGALDFDGSGDYVSVPDNSSLDLTSFTITAWIYADGTPDDWDTIVDKADDSIFGYVMRINSEKKFQGRVRVANGTNYQVDAPDVFPTDQWVFVAWSYNSSSSKIYINDSMVNEASGGGQDSSSGNDFIIASRGTDRFFNGKIDDVRIYNEVLSSEEIEEIYLERLYKATNPNPADGAAGVDPNVVLSWKLGRYADSHDVYLGTDYNDVNEADIYSAEYMGNFDVNSFDPCDLEPSTTYYWRVDEVNDANSDVWKGDVWSFKTITQLIGLSEREFVFISAGGETEPNDNILEITNIGLGTLNWTADCNCDWLVVEPNSGSSTGEISETILSIDANGLATDIYNCELTISDANADNSPQTVVITLYAMEDVPMMLNYDAEAYAYAYALSKYGLGTSKMKRVSSNNSKVTAQATANDLFGEYCDEFMAYWSAQITTVPVSAECIYGSEGAQFESKVAGSTTWDWYNECESTGDSGTGGGNGNGYTSLTGKIVIGAFEDYPFGSTGLSLKCSAEILGDSSSAWDDWDWWLEIWYDDPNNPLASMDDSSASATIDVLTGQILNFEFYHEAEEIDWPEAGLDSTVSIDLVLSSIVDLNGDGDINFEDFAILASQWRDAPGTPSADIAPVGGDGIVDFKDLGAMLEDWVK
jgi:hypothetical protein